MTNPIFGMTINQVADEQRPIVTSDMSVIGLVGTAPQANTDTYPVNTPVRIFSDDVAALTALGTTGTLPGAIEDINAQLGDFQVAAQIVIIRVAAGVDDEATMVNIVGSSTAKTGIWALTEAAQILGIEPRLIAVPGFTKQQQTGLTTLTLGTQGSNMDAAPTVTFTGGGTAPGKVLPTATAVLGTGPDAGKVVALNITDPGKNLSGSITVGFTGGGSNGSKVLPTATGVIDVLANPVVAALTPVLNQLLGVAVVSGPATTLQAFIDWRETISSKRIIPLETAVKVGVSATVRDGAPAVLGVAVRRDYEKGGLPFHSWANQPLQGIVGPNRSIRYSLTDGATEGQQILANNGGVILRGQAGVAGAIASGGFIYVGTDTCSDDDLWTFYNVVRGRDYIHLMFLKTLRFYLGKYNISGQTIEAILNTMKQGLRDLQADKAILGYKVFFTRDQNSPDDLRLGKFTVDFAAEEAPVLRNLGIQSRRYRPALDNLLTDLLAQVDVAA